MQHLKRFFFVKIAAVLLALILAASLSPTLAAASPTKMLQPKTHRLLASPKTAPFLKPLFTGGQGTSESPYLIETAGDLRGISQVAGDSDNYYELMNSVDLSVYGSAYNNTENGLSWTGWDPMGTVSPALLKVTSSATTTRFQGFTSTIRAVAHCLLPGCSV